MPEKIVPQPDAEDPNQKGAHHGWGAGSWSQWQVTLETSHYYKKVVTGVLLLFCFVDVLGTCLFMPAGPILCQQAEGGPIQSYAQFFLLPEGTDFKELGLKDNFIDLHGSPAVAATRAALMTGNLSEADALARGRQWAIDHLGNPKAFKDVPLKYSTSVNLLVMSGDTASGIGMAFWGWLGDRISRKKCMILCHFGGLAGYFLMWAAGVHWNSYWAYFGGQVVNGFFSGAFVLVNAYFLEIFTKEEAEGPCGFVMSMSLLGGAIGSLILMPFISGRGENLFDSSWIGIIGTIVSLILVVSLVVDKKKGGTAKARARQESAAKEPKPPMPKLLSRILWVTIIAGAFDAAGDEGTRIARGTVLQNTWPVTNDLMFQNVLLLSLIFLLFGVIALIGVGKKLVGYGATLTFGAFMTLLTQLLLNYKIIEWKSYEGFLGMWYGGKLFGMMSSFGAFFLMNDVAPEDEKGEWTGKGQGYGSVAGAIATMLIAVLYDENNDGTEEGKRGVVAMFVTASISFIAVALYSPLIAWVPKQVDSKQQEKKFLSVEEYEALSDIEWNRLTMEEVDFQETRRLKDGKNPRFQHWGKYTASLPELQGYIDHSKRDFEYLKQTITASLVDKKKMEEDRQMWLGMQDFLQANYDLEQEGKDMGQWIADYFNDAGYMNWFQYPKMYQVMIMNAFPPIDPLDNKQVDFNTVDLEHLFFGFLKVMDSHIKQRNGQLTFVARLGLNQLRFTRS